ncbi:MAG: hypothetical protein LBL04_14240 [Bacteroidales bacterium]|jgi:hypothetical protein|nr:hypothetical protein [Bacteroidales bacterium]
MTTVNIFYFFRNTPRIIKFIAILLLLAIALSRTRAPLMKAEIRWNTVAKSLLAFERYVRYDRDMDVRMLLANNYKELHYLKLAAAMCPAWFIPLYEPAKLYEPAGCHENALTIVRQVINKKIEIPSATVTAIKNAMRQLLEKEGNRDSATLGGTGNESKSHEPRQGETSEVSPRGNALPP